MNEINQDLSVRYDINKIVELIEQESNQKAVKDQIFGVEYMFGNIDETILTGLGFEFISLSNESGIDVPMYRLGNIEAIYNNQILHVYKLSI